MNFAMIIKKEKKMRKVRKTTMDARKHFVVRVGKRAYVSKVILATPGSKLTDLKERGLKN